MRWILLVVLVGCAETEPVPTAPAPAPTPEGRLVINEIAAAGTPSDWFEVVNAGDAPVDLGGYVYVDDERDHTKARPFEARVLAPGEHHVEEVTKDEVGFALGKSDELVIYRGEEIIDRVAWTKGASPRGGSYARVPDVDGAFETTGLATRRLANAAAPTTAER